jgi:D-tagatose-1,6-bisphosphate aldolase subunit GatZ/KbaZ
LIANLSAITIPETLLSAFLPNQYAAVRAGKIKSAPEAIVMDKVREALAPYVASGIMRLAS